jgi:PspA-Associated protein
MIVRISGEAQYRIANEKRDELNELDNAVVATVEGEDETRFVQSFAALLDFVRANGERLGDAELEGSDLILPPADLTLAEAKYDFSGEGLIPD